jgi:hypothetical protein
MNAGPRGKRFLRKAVAHSAFSNNQAESSVNGRHGAKCMGL